MSSGIQLVELTIRMAENIGLNYDEKVDYSLSQAFKMVPLDRSLNVQNLRPRHGFESHIE